MKVWRWIGWIVVCLTSVFFFIGGLQKVIGTEMMVTMFQGLGISDVFRVVIGVAEIIGSILLIIPRFTFYAACGLGILMIGAVGTEILHGRVFESLLAGQWLVVFVITAWIRFKIMSNKQLKKVEASIN